MTIFQSRMELYDVSRTIKIHASTERIFNTKRTFSSTCYHTNYSASTSRPCIIKNIRKSSASRPCIHKKLMLNKHSFSYANESRIIYVGVTKTFCYDSSCTKIFENKRFSFYSFTIIGEKLLCKLWTCVWWRIENACIGRTVLIWRYYIRRVIVLLMSRIRSVLKIFLLHTLHFNRTSKRIIPFGVV